MGSGERGVGSGEWGAGSREQGEVIDIYSPITQSPHPQTQTKGLTERGNLDPAELQPFLVRVDSYNPIDRYHGEFEGLIRQ